MAPIAHSPACCPCNTPPAPRSANTDPVLYYETQDKWIKEYWVHVEYMKLLKDEVRNCYRREGVNHYENCRDLVQEYYKRTKAPSVPPPVPPRPTRARARRRRHRAFIHFHGLFATGWLTVFSRVFLLGNGAGCCCFLPVYKLK